MTVLKTSSFLQILRFVDQFHSCFVLDVTLYNNALLASYSWPNSWILGVTEFVFLKRNWVFATNLIFMKPISQQPDHAYLSYFKLTLFDPPEFIVWNIYGLRYLVFKNPSLWQRLNSFEILFFTIMIFSSTGNLS